MTDELRQGFFVGRVTLCLVHIFVFFVASVFPEAGFFNVLLSLGVRWFACVLPFQGLPSRELV